MTFRNPALKQIQSMTETFRIQHRRKPTGCLLHVDRATEAELEKVRESDVGRALAKHVRDEGCRAAFNKLFGMTPVWNKDKLEIVVTDEWKKG